ncbi:MAG: DUF3857 domain-containing protein [Bacteroides graminisolvens]
MENKTKILKSDGTSYANVTIPYYDSNKNTMKELVIDGDAFSYNLENGKEVKTKMKKEYIFKERVSDKYMQVKFSIPNVKIGSVIEYKYKVLSDFYYQLPHRLLKDGTTVVTMSTTLPFRSTLNSTWRCVVPTRLKPPTNLCR